MSPAAPEGRTWARYPGSPPFEDTDVDRRLFFGREDDCNSVFHSILSHDLFVLYARSGIGKTSLLRAGVMDRLRGRSCWPVLVRLSGREGSPRDVVAAALEEADDDPRIEVAGLDPEASTLWDLLAQVEIWRLGDDALLLPVLLFDQFEELFTIYGPDDRQRFISEFADVVRRRPPDRRAASDREPTRPPRVKCVLSLREDFVGALEALATDVPSILRNRHRLAPLEREQAVDAIREPAGLPQRIELGDDSPGRTVGSEDASSTLWAEFEHPPFAYDDRTIELILDFLGASYRNDAGYAGSSAVEAFQLQIVCHHIESEILPHLTMPPEQPADDDAMVTVRPFDLTARDARSRRGDLDESALRSEVESGLSSMLQDFYARQVAGAGSGRARRRVRAVCERQLIRNRRRRFVAEDELVGGDRGAWSRRLKLPDRTTVDRQTLQRLVDGRLIRRERRGESTYYELAHDSLIEPLLDYRAERSRRARRIAGGLALATAVLVLALFGVIVARSTSESSVTSIDLGDVVDDDVANATEIDSYRFQIDDPSRPAVLSLEPLGDLDAIVEVVGPEPSGPESSGDVADVPTTSAGSSVFLPAGGTYRAQVRGVDGTVGRYRLSLEPADVTSLRVERPEVASLDVAGELDLFAFEGEADEARIVTLQAIDGVGGTAEVISERGQLLARIDSDGSATTASTTIPVDTGSIYYVLARGLENAPATYSVALGEASVESIGMGPITRRLEAPREVDVYTLDPEEGDVLTVGLSVEGTLDGIVDVIDPGGNRVAVADVAEVGDPEGLTTVVVGGGGSYLIRVSGASESTGDYVLTVDRAAATAVRPDDEVDGALDDGASAGFLTFTGATGDAVAIDVSADFDVAVALIGPGAGVVANVDVGGPVDGENLVAVLTEPGNHIVRLEGFGGATGEYRVRFNQSTGANVQSGERIRRSVGDAGVDVVTFAGTAGDVVELRLATATGESGTLELLDPAGDPLIDGSVTGPNASLTKVLPNSGTYLARIRLAGGGDYELELESTAVDRTAIGTSFDGRIERSGEVDVIAFSGSTDDVLTVTMDVDPDLNGVIELVGPDGELLARADTESTGETESITELLPEGGTYVLRLRGFAGSSGSYRVGLDRPAPREIKIGADVDGDIDVPYSVAHFTVRGAVGDVIGLRLGSDDDLDGVLTVVSPEGVLAGEVNAREAGSDESLTLVLPDDGTYRVLVRGFAGSTGRFSLELDESVVSELTVGDVRRGRLDRLGDVDAYTFAGATDDVVTLVLVADDQLDGRFVVYNPDGGQVADVDERDSPSATERITLILPEGGRYTVLVNGFVSIGSYEIGLERAEIVEIDVGETVSDRIETPRGFDVYSFDGAAGERPTISVDPAADLDVIVEIIDPSGGLTQGVNQSGPGVGEEFSLTLPEDRIYYVQIRSVAGTTGTYSIEVS